MVDETTPMPTLRDAAQRSDEEIWLDIIKLQLDGAMTHVALFEQLSIKELPGCAAAHKHHAEEEFGCYLHVVGDYINLFKHKPVLPTVSSIVIELKGNTPEEIMMNGLEGYEEWEKSACEHFKKYQAELSMGKEHVNCLINGVKNEIKHIHLMENDIMDGKYQELEKWLANKFE